LIERSSQRERLRCRQPTVKRVAKDNKLRTNAHHRKMSICVITCFNPASNHITIGRISGKFIKYRSPPSVSHFNRAISPCRRVTPSMKAFVSKLCTLTMRCPATTFPENVELATDQTSRQALVGVLEIHSHSRRPQKNRR
jgi:hypothetical protein